MSKQNDLKTAQDPDTIAAQLTHDCKMGYNETKGMPVRCRCNKIIAYRKDGKLYIRCRGCGKEFLLYP